MPIPDFQSLFLPLLRLAHHTEYLRTTAAIVSLSDAFQLTDNERRELLKTGRQTRMANRVYWAFIHLAKAGLLERTERGVYAITDKGKHVLEKTPESLTMASLAERSEAYRQFRNTALPATVPEPCCVQEEDEQGKTPEERIDAVCNEMENTLSSELDEKLRTLSDQQFERLIIELMLGLGYGAKGLAKHTGRSGDGGIDGVITEDILGLDVIYLQAKHYAPNSPIGSQQIQSFIGAMDSRGATKGVFVTTSRFTDNAYAEVRRNPKHLKLIDGKELTQLMILHNIGVRNSRTITLKKIDLDFFEEMAG